MTVFFPGALLPAEREQQLSGEAFYFPNPHTVQFERFHIEGSPEVPGQRGDPRTIDEFAIFFGAGRIAAFRRC